MFVDVVWLCVKTGCADFLKGLCWATINSLAAHVHQLVNGLSRFGTIKVTRTPAVEVSPNDIWNELMDKILRNWCWSLFIERITIPTTVLLQLAGLWRHQNLGNCTRASLHWLERYQSARPADARNKFQLFDIRCQWASRDSDLNVCVVLSGDPEITCPLGLTRAQIAKKQATSCAVFFWS